jgi:hypothetical protein
MRINHVLVDYENVTAVDLRELRRDDVRVVIFLGSNQQKLPSELAIQMQALGERGEYVQVCGNGPNALDFHIAFTIGERCRGEAPSFFHIISNDAGFDPLIKYLRRKKILAARYKAISEIPAIKSSQPKTATTRADYFMEKLSSPTSTKPRTSKTLGNAIRTLFHRQLSDKEVDAILAILCSQDFVKITDGKVTYPERVGGRTDSAEAFA